jgi:RNA polymerase primary sigma factor
MTHDPSDSRSGSLELYLRDIARSEPLERGQEAELARRWRDAGDRRALDALVRANLRFVVMVAKRYRNRGLPLEDLVNEGNVGLLRAAERFEPEREVRFISYAVWWIRQSIHRALARAEAPSPPGGVRPRRPRPPFGAQHVGAVSSFRIVSLDEPLAERSGARLADLVPDEKIPAPEVALERQRLRDRVDSRLATLPEREESVLRLYFGLDGLAPNGLAEIGRKLGVSRERVRQIKARALARLASERAYRA